MADSGTPMSGAMEVSGGNVGGSSRYQPAGDDEEVYYEGTPMLRGDLPQLVMWWLIGGALIAIPIGYRVGLGRWPWVGATVGLILVGLIILALSILRVRANRYRITNYRIDVERGLLGRTIDTLELWHVEDIRFHQSLWDRLVGVGQITVISHDDTTPRLDLIGIPRPKEIFQTLEQRVIAVKRQRGVIKTDAGM